MPSGIYERKTTRWGYVRDKETHRQRKMTEAEKVEAYGAVDPPRPMPAQEKRELPLEEQPGLNFGTLPDELQVMIAMFPVSLADMGVAIFSPRVVGAVLHPALYVKTEDMRTVVAKFQAYAKTVSINPSPLMAWLGACAMVTAGGAMSAFAALQNERVTNARPVENPRDEPASTEEVKTTVDPWAAGSQRNPEPSPAPEIRPEPDITFSGSQGLRENHVAELVSGAV